MQDDSVEASKRICIPVLTNAVQQTLIGGIFPSNFNIIESRIQDTDLRANTLQCMNEVDTIHFQLNNVHKILKLFSYTCKNIANYKHGRNLYGRY